MANDTPFVELPSPPRSPSQTPKEADARGYDYAISVDDDEHERAIAYREHVKALARFEKANLKLLRGSKAAARTLQHKTLALTNSAPPYIEVP